MTVSVKTFRDLMAGHQLAEIVCPVKGTVVRRLALQGNALEIDAVTVKVTVDIDDPIRFEPWVLDRGNLLFSAPGFFNAKLCTEADTIRYADGSERSIHPAGRR
jgi:hypothetical protein